MNTPSVTLPSGNDMPVVGIGTWDVTGDAVEDAVRTALEAGYTHIDTAEGYMNESEIGDAIADYDREKLFLTSKVLPKNLDYESVLRACDRSLERLGTDYLDLYLIHWPNPAVSLRETLDAMETLRDEGSVRNVGVSNFSPYQLSVAHHISETPIAVNQIEYHPWLQRSDWVEYCRESETVVEAAAPLARTEILGDEVIREVAEKYDKNPAQVVLRWAIENDVVVVPKSTSPEHICENRELFDWELETADRERIDGRDRDYPVYDDRTRDWSDDVYGISQ